MGNGGRLTRRAFEERLLGFVRGTLLGGAGPAVDRDTPLFEHGILNSLRILDLIAFVERTLEVKVPDRAIRLSNFRSIAVIAAAFAPDGPGARESDGDGGSLAERGGELFDRPAPAVPHHSVPALLAALEAAGEVRSEDPGRVSLSGAPLRLLERFDRTFRRWGRELGAADRRYPALIPLAQLARAGYPAAFPQHLTVAAATADDGARRRLAERPGELDPADLGRPAHALAPAVCYHCYPEVAGRTLGGEPLLLGAAGRCFRHEEAPAPLERLRDFTMREIVVLGSREQVEAVRHELVRRAAALVEALDLGGRVEPAGDPFFLPEAEGRRLLQRLGTLKYELRLALGGGRTVAAASFNHHLDFFGRAFDIRRGGEPAHSGCVAFGLERWVLAFLARHGADASAWPAPVPGLDDDV